MYIHFKHLVYICFLQTERGFSRAAAPRSVRAPATPWPRPGGPAAAGEAYVCVYISLSLYIYIYV